MDADHLRPRERISSDSSAEASSHTANEEIWAAQLEHKPDYDTSEQSNDTKSTSSTRKGEDPPSRLRSDRQKSHETPTQLWILDVKSCHIGTVLFGIAFVCSGE